jgi:hypothetical protein
MKKLICSGILVSFLLAAAQSNAEMKMTPNGITFPDKSTQTKAVSGAGVSAPLNLNGSFYTDYPEAIETAVIAATNEYSGDIEYSYGGLFSCHGIHGAAIKGISHNESGGTGVSGRANGADGIGVFGYSSSLNGIGKGVSGTTHGANGSGVYGEAGSSTGISGETNYGGYLLAHGTSGRGVYGYADNDGNITNYGGYFEAKGAFARAVWGEALNTGSVVNFGGTFIAKGALGVGVSGSGGLWDFYADGSGTDYGPFTGAHEVKFSRDMSEENMSGLIVSTTGKTELRKNESGKVSLSSTLPTVTLSTKANDKAVFGVVVRDAPLPKDHWYESQKGETFGVVNALGEGRVWVTNRNGNIENGDYITTSEIPGYGQMQDDDFLHSYTLGKAIESVDWEQVSEIVEHDGETYKRYLIAIVYTSG